MKKYNTYKNYAKKITKDFLLSEDVLHNAIVATLKYNKEKIDVTSYVSAAIRTGLVDIKNDSYKETPVARQDLASKEFIRPVQPANQRHLGKMFSQSTGNEIEDGLVVRQTIEWAKKNLSTKDLKVFLDFIDSGDSTVAFSRTGEVNSNTVKYRLRMALEKVRDACG